MFGRMQRGHIEEFAPGSRRRGLARLLVLGVIVAVVAKAITARRTGGPPHVWHA